MYVTLVHVRVKTSHIDDFIAATQQNHQHAVNEKGNRRFDVLQSPADPGYFILYEAYDSESDAIAHKDTPHYLAWRQTVANWMAEPRRGETFTGLYPA